MTFFCPKCGVQLVPVESDGESLRYECHNRACIYDDTTFIVHHPFFGLDSEPEDSWSITWLK